MSMAGKESSNPRTPFDMRDCLRLYPTVHISNLSPRSRILASRRVRTPGTWIALVLTLACVASSRIGSAQQQQGDLILDTHQQLFCLPAAFNSPRYDSRSRST